MNRLQLSVNLHENWFYSVGNRVAGVVDVVEKLDSISGQNVIVIVGVGRVSPAQAEEDREGRAQTEKVFYSEEQSALGWLGRLGGEISPSTGCTGRSGELTGAPGMLHVLAPATQHVVGYNTA